MKYVNHHHHKKKLTLHTLLNIGPVQQRLAICSNPGKILFLFPPHCGFVFGFPSHFLMLLLKDLKTWRVSVPRPQPQGRAGLNSSSSGKRKFNLSIESLCSWYCDKRNWTSPTSILFVFVVFLSQWMENSAEDGEGGWSVSPPSVQQQQQPGQRWIYAQFSWRRSYTRVSARGASLSVQAATAVWRRLLLVIHLGVCVSFGCNCMELHAADGVEWWISKPGPQLLGKAITDPFFVFFCTGSRP